MRALISGILHEAPAMKTSKAGKDYCIGKIKDDSTTPATWASCVCFEEQAVTLAGMKKGETLSVSGKLTVDVYQPPQGEPRANISITCDSIITLKPAKKPVPPEFRSAGSKGNGKKAGSFDYNKFKRDSGYKPQPAPPPPEGSDPF